MNKQDKKLIKLIRSIKFKYEWALEFVTEKNIYVTAKSRDKNVDGLEFWISSLFWIAKPEVYV